MAHLNNSGIQQHSAGDIFPYVIFRQESDGRKQWGIIGPGATDSTFDSYDDARTWIIVANRHTWESVMTQYGITVH